MLDQTTFATRPGAKTEIQERLQTTLETGRMPSRMRSSGQTLADRLAAPVRLSLMGMPGAGKTTLIRALLGVETPSFEGGSDDMAPSFALSYGDALQGCVTFEDGTRDEVTAADLADGFHRKAIYADLQMPCDRLRDIHMFELVTDGSAEELLQATPWAAERCEIPIWCSRRFDATEAQIWAQVPDRLKDHAILVLTQADRQTPDGMTDWLDSAHDLANAGFSIIVPVAAERAYEAQIGRRQDVETIMQACGVEALWQEIMHHVEQGRQTDLAHAERFLKRFERVRGRRATELRDPENLDLTQAPESKMLSDAHGYLRHQASEMLADIEEFGPFAQARIVERCLEAANHVVDLIADDMAVNAEQVLAHNAVSDAADMLLLMTLENTPDAAEDAVHLIIQVQRELELAA